MNILRWCHHPVFSTLGCRTGIRWYTVNRECDHCPLAKNVIQYKYDTPFSLASMVLYLKKMSCQVHSLKQPYINPITKQIAPLISAK